METNFNTASVFNQHTKSLWLALVKWSKILSIVMIVAASLSALFVIASAFFMPFFRVKLSFNYALVLTNLCQIIICGLLIFTFSKLYKASKQIKQAVLHHDMEGFNGGINLLKQHFKWHAIFILIFFGIILLISFTSIVALFYYYSA